MLSQKSCTFCNKDVPLGEGTMLIKNDGSIYWYCSSKCRKNSIDLKRDSRRFKWASNKKADE